MQGLTSGCDLDLWPGRDAPDRAALRRGASNADGLLCLLSDSIDADLLQASPRLRAISSYSVGTDHIDLAAATARGIPVGHTPGVLTETTADLTFALILAAARRIPEADQLVRSGTWSEEESWQPDLLLGRDVYGATLGLIGFGAIAQAVAQRALGFGMRVRAWNRTPRTWPGVEMVDFDEVLANSAFVSVHVARSPETLGLLGSREIGRMKEGAVLINTARGGLVDEAALIRALETRKLWAAGLDVFDQEPIPANSPLRTTPGLILAPHIGSASLATRVRMAELAVENLRAGLAGVPMPHCANPEVYD